MHWRYCSFELNHDINFSMQFPPVGKMLGTKHLYEHAVMSHNWYQNRADAVSIGPVLVPIVVHYSWFTWHGYYNDQKWTIMNRNEYSCQRITAKKTSIVHIGRVLFQYQDRLSRYRDHAALSTKIYIHQKHIVSLFWMLKCFASLQVRPFMMKCNSKL